MDMQDKVEIRLMVKEELDNRFPEKYCPKCKESHRMVKFEKFDDEEEEYITSFKCLYCGSEFVEELRKV